MSYTVSVLMLIDMVCAIVPNFTFLSMAMSLYVIYIAFEGVDNFLQVGQMRGIVAVVSCAAIYAAPHVILFIFGLFR